MSHSSSFARTVVLSAVALLGLADSSLAQTKVVGYAATSGGIRATVDRVDLAKLTHLNISFANPSPGGSFLNGGSPACMSGSPTAADINYAVQKARAAGVKVSIAIGGANANSCGGNWATLLQPASRATTVNNIKQFVTTFALDGVDVDLEGTLLTSIDNAGNFTPFVQALRTALPGKLITAATASYSGGMVPTSSLPSFDFVNIMSYDKVGPGWGTVGDEHASYAKAQADIAIWKSRGLPKAKMVLGVPFYGYGFNGYAANWTFAGILNQFGTGAAQNDVIGTRSASTAYITYNGIPTIKAKTRLGLQDGAGVMIWEVGQDASGANSLLTAIRSEMNAWTKLIEAEWYDNDLGVDVEDCAEGGRNVTYIDATDWMVYYNVAIPTTGSYRLEYRVASPNGARMGANLNSNQVQFPAINIPATGGLQTWTTITQTVTINAGTYNLGIYASQGGWNLNWIRITKL